MLKNQLLTRNKLLRHVSCQLESLAQFHSAQEYSII